MTYLGYVVHNDNLEFVAVRSEIILQVSDLALGANGATNGEAALKELLNDLECNETVGSCDKNLSGGDGGHGYNLDLSEM